MEELKFENKKAQEIYDKRMAEIDDYYSDRMGEIEEMIECEPDVVSVAAKMYMLNQHRSDLIASALKMAHDYELRERMYLHTISSMASVTGRSVH